MKRPLLVISVALAAVTLMLGAAFASGTFADDDGNIHEQSIEAIAAAGITKGCDPPANDLFCPNRPVTRGQMAAFLKRALKLPSSSQNAFVDDDSSIFEADIQALAAAGITKGCNPPTNDRFCPDSVVSREQMAAFLTRALSLPGSSVDRFVDDDASIFEGDIQALAGAGITKGCNPPANDRFCPKQIVTRAQMATFLFRALDLPVPPPAGSDQPTAPIRAAFFYPWFPEAWDQGSVVPFTNFSPSLGTYDTEDSAVIAQQLAMAKDAGIEAFISSWWGRGHHTDVALGTLLDETTKPGSANPDLRWAIYYEEEGQTDPSSATIVSDLEYLEANYFNHPGYLRVKGKPVVFVWADSGDAQGMANRWASAKAAFGGDVFVVLKVFAGYATAGNQPDSWHQYGPASAYSEHLPYSAVVSPGFWLVGESPRLGRNIGRFTTDVQRMANSGAFWQLITSWNEWGEGTAVEPATEFGTTYLDVLAGIPTVDPPPVPSAAITFTAGGDIGAGGDTDSTLKKLASQKGDFFLALGDLSYSALNTESDWCAYMKGHLGSTFPMQLIVGNHEDDDRLDGFIGDFAACLPDRMGSIGTYGAEYYFDVDGLARFVMIGAGNDVDGTKYDYEVGNARYQWLTSTIDDARSDGLEWIIVGMHKPCLTAGTKSCEVGADLAELLVEKKVDLVISGHDHSYQRSHQLDCITIDTYQASCVSDFGSDDRYARGNGTVFVIAGLTGGSGLYDVDPADPEFPYFESTLGAGDPSEGRGFFRVTITSAALTGSFIGSTTTFSDTFTID